MALPALGAWPGAVKPRTVLLRSGWQTVNIGDVAHTPGVLCLLEKHVPDAAVILWSNALEGGVEAMLRRRFPKLRIVSGEPGDREVRQAIDDSDFFLHGSGPGVVARDHLEAWRRITGKPYGIYGVTIPASNEAARAALDPAMHDLLKAARFVFTRETASLENLRRAGLEGPEIGFAPDGTFSLDLEDEKSALTFLRENGLESKKFIAVVPRLRYTPYHKFRKVNLPEAEIQRRTALSERHQEADHSRLREAIATWVRRTGNKALLCPEMSYELEIIDPLLYDRLPADVKKSTVRRKTFWLPDEAASVYRRAVAVLSFECHSPIIAAAQGTPCMYIHQPEDGIKGQMWKDVGLADWYFEIDKTSGAQIAGRLMEIHSGYAAATARLNRAVQSARRIQAERMASLRRQLN